MADGIHSAVELSSKDTEASTNVRMLRMLAEQQRAVIEILEIQAMERQVEAKQQ
ncbi:hypothetical protein LPJ59_006802, partial [Coemansia sp. RSA 2399]